MSIKNRASIAQLRTEHQTNPVGIDVAIPRLSWQLLTHPRATAQTAYQIVVGRSANNGIVQSDLDWDSGRIKSDQSLDVEYGGPMLVSRRKYF
jgi:alpha-L-rhamnosidase